MTDQTTPSRVPPDKGSLVADWVNQFNVARKNLKLYPPGHPQVAGAMEQMARCLESLFSGREDLCLEASAEDLSLDGESLAGHPAFAEMAAFLQDKAIYSLAFRKGVSADELLLFLRILNGEKGLVGEGENIAQALARHGVGSVTVGLVDCRAPQAAGAADAAAAANRPEAAPGGGWQEAVQALLAGDPQPLVEGGVRLTALEPEKLAGFLDLLHHKEGDSAFSFDRAAALYLSEVESSGPDPGDASRAKSALFSLFASLGRELRAIFSARVLKHSAKNPELAVEVLTRVPVSLLLEALEGVDAHGMNIHPKILEV
ncbi:MAG: hypothetical protein JRI97_11835, partial [Deltaproteobacteria bacterium]|nr:hypothetical protein [Deltaproteobacteria bacterium]